MLGYEDGWGELYDAVTKSDMTSPALSARATISIAPHLKAYEDIGLVKETPIKQSLEALLRLMAPRVISDTEFKKGLRTVASSLLPTLTSTTQGSTVFAMESDGVKSNLWVFLLIMQHIRSVSSLSTWRSIIKKVWVVLPSRYSSGDTTTTPNPKGEPPRPLTLVLADDCAYSGQQMGMMSSRMTSEKGVFDSVVMCPVFATMLAIENVSRMLPDVSIAIPHVIGYKDNIARKVAVEDIALCMQGVDAAGSGWIIMSMFEIMGVLKHYIQTSKCQCFEPCQDHGTSCQWYSGEVISASATVVGAAAVVFAHKVADTVSVPTRWFTLGPTLRRAVDLVCPSMMCKKNGKVMVRIATVKLRDVLAAFDYDPEKPVNKDKRWTFTQNWNKPFIINCSDVALTPVLKTSTHTPIVIDVAKMPVFSPLLQPVDVCGPAFGAAKKFADSGDWWGIDHAEEMMRNNLKHSARCITPQYKSKLRKRLQTLMAVGKATRLCKAIGVTASDSDKQ